MTYQIARFVAEHTLEFDDKKYWFRGRAQKAADSLNAARPKSGALVEFVRGPGGQWTVFSSTALAHTIARLAELKWQEKDAELRERRNADFKKAAQALDGINAGHPETVPARTLPWLDEDPTDRDGLRYAEPSEEDWDAANAGSLKGISCWPPLEDGEPRVSHEGPLPVRTPGGALVDEPVPVVTFVPRYAEPEDLPHTVVPADWEPDILAPEVQARPENYGFTREQADAAANTLIIPSYTKEDDLRASAELEKAFQESPVSEQVEAFLADPDAGVKVTRPARKRTPRKPTADDITF